MSATNINTISAVANMPTAPNQFDVLNWISLVTGIGSIVLGLLALILTVGGIYLAWIFYKKGADMNDSAQATLKNVQIHVEMLRSETIQTKSLTEDIRNKLLDAIIFQSKNQQPDLENLFQSIEAAKTEVQQQRKADKKQFAEKLQEINRAAEQALNSMKEHDEKAQLAMNLSHLSNTALSVLIAVHFLEGTELEITTSHVLEITLMKHDEIEASIKHLTNIGILERVNNNLNLNASVKKTLDDLFYVDIHAGMRFAEYCNAIRERLERWQA